MKTDEQLREQLQDMFKAVLRDEPVVTSTSPARAPRRGYVRARQWKFAPLAAKFALSGALAGAVAVGAVVMPQITDKPPTEDGTLVDPASSGSPLPSPTPATPTTTPQPAEPTLTFTNSRISYTLQYPKNWSKAYHDALEDNYIAFVSPNDLAKREYHFWQQRKADCDQCPVAVPVQLMNFAEHDEYVRLMRTIVDKWRKQGVKVTESRVTVAKRRAIRFHVTFPDRAAADPQDQEWCRACEGDWTLIPWYHRTTLDVRVIALSPSAYDRDGERGLRIVNSIRSLGEPRRSLMPTPASDDAPPVEQDEEYDPYKGWETWPPNCNPSGTGSISSTVKCDHATDLVIRFSAGRQNNSADHALGTQAKKQYDSHEGGLWLYPPPGERAWESYFITERRTMSDGTIRFTVEMNQGHVEDNGDRIRVEHLFVAQGKNWKGEPTIVGHVVVRATLVSSPTEP